MHRFFHRIFSLLFGDFNGVQVFLYPMTLFLWIDSNSFLYAVSGLVTDYRHFFPLALFLLLFLYLAFLIVKNSSSILSDTRKNTPAEKRSFYAMVIEVHKILLITVVCAAFLYGVAAFLQYFYRIQLPLRMIYPYLLRIFSVSLLVFYSLKNSWTKPYRERGHSMEEANNMAYAESQAHPKTYATHAIVLILMIMIGSFVYNLFVINLIYPVLESAGIAPNLYLTTPVNIAALLYDIFILGVAFMLSNLFFSPLVILISHISNWFHPYELLAGNSQENAETSQ